MPPGVGILWRASGEISCGEQNTADEGENGKPDCWTELGWLYEFAVAKRRARSEPSLVTLCTHVESIKGVIVGCLVRPCSA